MNEFEVTPREVYVRDQLPLALIHCLYSMSHHVFRTLSFSHNPGLRIMAAWQIPRKMSFAVACGAIEPLSAEINSKKHIVRFATLEESLSHQESFPEDFTKADIFIFGETFKDAKGNICIAHGHYIESVRTLESIKADDVAYYGSSKNVIPIVFEPVPLSEE